MLMRFLYLRSLRLLRSLSLLLSLCSYQVVGATVLMRFLYLRDHPHGIDEEEDRPTTRASLQGRRGSLDVGTALISQATRAQEAEGASADDDNAIQDVQQSESCFKIMAPYVNSFCMFSALAARSIPPRSTPP